MKRIKVILLIPSAREFDRGVLRGIVEYAHIHGPWTFCEEPPAYLQTLGPRQRLALMRQWNADGIITPQSRLKEVRPLRLPTVALIGQHHLSPRHCQLACDNQAIGQMAAQSLLGLGLRHFAYCGMEGVEFSTVRGTAFCRTIKQAGYEAQVYNPPAHHAGRSWYTEEQHLGQWLFDLPKPVGLMTCNDDRARMIAEICHTRQIRVPDEISILGVDNDEQVCRRATPPLSSVAMATERAGYEAAALLYQLVRGQAVSNPLVLVHPTHVVTRHSTDLIALDDPCLVKAMRYIRNNSHHVFQVQDVANAAGISRRILQDRFQKTTGRTVMEEIHRSRIQRISSLLLGTNMTVAEIAAATGYNADAHIARFFSRQTGLTPLEYRRKYQRPSGHWRLDSAIPTDGPEPDH